MTNIRRGVLLHDIGKMGIPDNILLKQGPLEAWERKIIEKHPAFAREMLSQIEFLHPCMDIPSCHHERWDGRGYPDGLAGDEIPLTARIFAVIDVWDALTSDRPYRKAWSMDAAVQYIQENAGKHFDPQVVQVFLEWIESQDLDRYEAKTVPASVLVHDKSE
jgi:HD-GYP domain-containing protein (c-di-GMP phosphodiesterase class II)